MEVARIIDRKQWEEFVLGSKWTPFFQSWDFGEASQKEGREVIRLGVFDGEKLKMAGQTVVIRAKRATFIQLRHGPVFYKFEPASFSALLQSIVDLAKKNSALFIRMSPLLAEDTHLRQFLKQKGFVNAPTHNQDAENCLLLPLDMSLDDIFKNFRKTTRNLIRRAEKEEVLIKKTTKQSDFLVFLQLYNETARREKFVPHQGIENEFELFKKIDSVVLFIGYHKGVPQAASLIVFYGKQAVYHHSGSIKSGVPVNYLLQWEAIKEAKRRGCKYYNFWGVSPLNNSRHPWRGLTTFKEGFGGERMNFLHAQDLPLNKHYWLLYLYEKYWSWRRGYS